MVTMGWTGCGLQLVSHVKTLFAGGPEELFLALFKTGLFRIFPWYVPLIEKRCC